MDDLLREAIADAKAVRETALENAKIALEEAFTPRLQSMLSKKIAAESEDAEENEMDAEESEDHEEMRGMEEEEAEEMEMDAEEMDAEESEDHEEMREESEDAEETEDAEEEDSVEESEDAEEEDSVEESEDAEEEDSVEEQEDAEEEDELDLESVLAELEKDLDDEDQVEEMEDKDEEEMDESEDKEEDEKMDENDVSSDIGKSDNKVNPKANDSTGAGQGPEGEGSDKKAGTELGDHKVVKEEEDAEESDLDLDEVLRALTEEEAEEQDAEENEKLKSEIKEHRKVIHFMRSKLNEVNLLNAKLLFSNKLFRAFGLNNNQKLKVVETFDRTKNLREVKLVYATLAESFKKPGNRLSESVTKGSSSKPVRSTKPVKEVLSEGQELRNRFKKLANIL
jgi:hypothetical protein